ncbi:MAG: hypothetical protein WCH01_11920 [Methylococcaceae bacterium]
MGNFNKRIFSQFFLLAILIHAGSLTPSFANNNLDTQKQALDIVADFADKFCKQVPLEGSTGNVELSGNAKAELNGLLKNLANLGIEGATKYQTSEYQGLLQKDLVEGLKSSTNCRLQVWDGLKNKLITSQPDEKDVIQQNISGDKNTNIGNNNAPFTINNQ